MALRKTALGKVKRTYLLPVEIQPLDEGGYLAICSALQRSHAEGASIVEALDNLHDVATNLIELRLIDGLGVPKELEVLEPKDTIHGQYS